MDNLTDEILYDRDAEMSTLGAMLIDGAVVDDVICQIPAAAAFYLPENAAVYRLIVALHEKGTPCSLPTFEAQARQHGTETLEALGGSLYAVELADTVAGSVDAPYHARIVADLYRRRCLVTLSEELRRAAKDQTLPVLDLAASMANRIEKVGVETQGKVVSMHSTLDSIATEFEAGERGSHIRTGFHRLDAMTGGLTAGDLTVLAGRPSIGKTALAMSLMVSALQGGAPVLFFSVEMGVRSIAKRMVSLLAGISTADLRDNTSPEAFRDAANHTKAQFADKFFVSDLITNVREMAATSRAYVRRHGVRLVVVDYLQLCQPAEPEQNRNLAVAEMSATFKRLGRDTGAAMLILSQLSRAATGKRPELSELRDSGAIEQDADLVIFLWRSGSNVMLSIQKQRNGPLGEFALNFDGARMQFSEGAMEPREAVSF